MQSLGSNEHALAAFRRRVRLVLLLDAAEEAGLTPIPLLRLHAFAYLANVLSPVWNLIAQDQRVLKRRGGPFYPELQHDLDHLVTTGVACIERLSYAHDERGRCHVEGYLSPITERTLPILELALTFREEQKTHKFLREIAFALADLSDKEFAKAMIEDATYADPRVDENLVIDYAEWEDAVNYSDRAANYFERVSPLNLKVSPGAKLHLYIRHLERRAHGGRRT